jgi:hypothetical protein
MQQAECQRGAQRTRIMCSILAGIVDYNPMRVLASLYSFLFGSSALWRWVSYFFYKNSEKEHLFPSIILNILTLPSSLLIDKLAEQVSWVLNNPIIMLILVTGLGVFQVVLVWLFAAWYDSPSPCRLR